MGTHLPPKGHSPQFSAHVYCGKTAEWIKMPLGMKVDLSPRRIVLYGDPVPTPPPKKGGTDPPSSSSIVAEHLLVLHSTQQQNNRLSSCREKCSISLKVTIGRCSGRRKLQRRQQKTTQVKMWYARLWARRRTILWCRHAITARSV